ncbi:MAG: WbqC family protein [Sphingomonadales bacterium]|nr:WbqC family protein [Sphingomonadales bacterium]
MFMEVGANVEKTSPENLILEYGPNILNMAKIQRMPIVRFKRLESFQKATGRNRMLIGSSQGPALLSIPILGGRSHHQRYGETRVDHRLPWKRQHLGAFKSNYGKSPYWGHYSDRLYALYEPDFSLLFDWNLHVLAFFVRLLCPETTISDDLEFPQSPINPLQNSQPDSGIVLPRYYQVFEQKTGFLSNLSVIDLLLNVGHPCARLYLENLTQPN